MVMNPMPLHVALKSFGPYYFESDGSSSVSTTYLRGGKNKHYDKVHEMIIRRGYKRVMYNRYGSSKYEKELNEGRNTATVEVRHEPDGHVYSVDTITYHNHY